MTKRFAFLSVSIAAAALAGLAGCNSGGGGNAIPTPGPTCTPPPGISYALVYPAPNSTAIPDSFGQVIVGSTSPGLPSTWDVVVTTALSPGGVAGGTFTAASPPFPTPAATPSFSNPVYQSSSFSGGNFPGEVVTVYINNASSNCTPIGPIGSFTTQ